MEGSKRYLKILIVIVRVAVYDECSLSITYCLHLLENLGSSSGLLCEICNFRSCEGFHW